MQKLRDRLLLQQELPERSLGQSSQDRMSQIEENGSYLLQQIRGSWYDLQQGTNLFDLGKYYYALVKLELYSFNPY